LDDSKDILLSFGKRVRELRLVREMSQEELADLAEIDRSYLGGVERGERNISLVNINKIAAALGFKTAELLL
jgi:transcriptional regulator with XRE-family HTH domain